MKIESIEHLTKLNNEDIFANKQRELKRFAKFIIHGFLNGKYAMWESNIETIVSDYLGKKKPEELYRNSVAIALSPLLNSEIDKSVELKNNIHNLIREKLNGKISQSKVSVQSSEDISK